MYPLLFEIPIFGGIRIYTYGVLVALAYFTGILWTTHEAKKSGISSELVLDLAFYIIIASLVGARTLYIIIEWKRYTTHPLDMLKIWEGGLVFYGGLIGAMITAIGFIKKHRLNFFKIADVFVPGLSLGHAIGRLGCFAAGCCYGKEAPHSFLAVVYPPNHFSLAPAGIPLLPSQLFESAASLLIFFVLVFWRKRKRFEGERFLIYVILYSVARAFLETLRGNSVQGFIIPQWLSTSQMISGVLVMSAMIIYYKKRRLYEKK